MTDIEGSSMHPTSSMPVLSSTTLLDVLVVGGSIAWLQHIISSKRRTNLLPPGPPRLPFIGNALDMPKSHLWEKAAEWKKEYGMHALTVA